MRVPGKTCESQVEHPHPKPRPIITGRRWPSRTIDDHGRFCCCLTLQNTPPPPPMPLRPNRLQNTPPPAQKTTPTTHQPPGSTQKQAEQCCPTPPKLPQSLHTSPPGICNRCCICKAGCVWGWWWPLSSLTGVEERRTLAEVSKCGGKNKYA